MLPLPGYSNVETARLLDPLMDASQKKKLADIALNATKALGATYTDVRIARYLNQDIEKWARIVKISGAKPDQ